MFGLTGWKTKVGGVGNMLGGIGLVALGLAQETVSLEMMAAGYAQFMLGVGMLGIGHKIEKAAITDAPAQ